MATQSDGTPVKSWFKIVHLSEGDKTLSASQS
jgi:hypothetical protein